jgi:hypothetical protein
VPTDRARHTITETDDVIRALDDAARRWPDDHGGRRALLLRLVHEGHRAIGEREARDVARRRDAIQGTAGALSGLYEPGYLDRLRDDWPA